MSRAPKQPIMYQERLKIPKDFLRFATPKDIASYRAERLKCNVLVELGAGIGGQTIAFSRKCKKVIAVELNKERAKVLNDNIKKLKIKNVEVINGDALNKSIIQKIAKEKPDIVFFDTERPEESDRTLNQIQPPVDKIIETYSALTSRIAIEIPPFTNDIQSLRESFDFEEEFISLNNQLNRLTLYFNELKTCNKCAVALPSKEKIEVVSHMVKVKEEESARGYKYLYAIDPAILVSHLEGMLASRLNTGVLYLHKPVLISNNQVKSYFLTGYKIFRVCKNNEREILNELKNAGAKKVTLRYNVDPKDYWKQRNFYEKELTGKKEISLFVNEKEAILCEKI